MERYDAFTRRSRKYIDPDFQVQPGVKFQPKTVGFWWDFLGHKLQIRGGFREFLTFTGHILD